MWSKTENKKKMNSLDLAHQEYLRQTNEIRTALFDHLEDPELAKREEEVFLLHKEKRNWLPNFIQGLPFVKSVRNIDALQHDVNRPDKDVTNSIKDNASDYMFGANHNPENLKQQQHEFLTFLCLAHRKVKESPFLIFCEEIKRWAVNLPTVSAANYHNVMALVDAKIAYAEEIIDQEIFFERNDFLYELIEELEELKIVLFENQTNQDIIDALGNLENALYPLRKQLLCFLFFAMRHKLPKWVSENSKNPARDAFAHFRERKLSSKDYYTKNVLLELVSFQDEQAFSEYSTSLSKDIFLMKYHQYKMSKNLLCTEGETGEIISTFFHLHEAFESFLKVNRAIQLLHASAQGFGSLAFYAVLKDAVYYIFPEFNRAAQQVTLEADNLYKQLRQHFRGEEKTEAHKICLQASKYAYIEVKKIIARCRAAQSVILEKISTYNQELDFKRNYENLRELIMLCRDFGPTDGFYSHFLEEVQIPSIIDNPYSFNVGPTVKEIEDGRTQYSGEELLSRSSALLQLLSNP